MDGSCIVFAACLSTGLEHKLRQVKFLPGALLVIRHCNIIRMDSGVDNECKVFVIIHDFDFFIPQKKKEVEGTNAVEDDKHTLDDSFDAKDVFVDTRAIDHGQKTGFISHLARW